MMMRMRTKAMLTPTVRVTCDMHVSSWSQRLPLSASKLLQMLICRIGKTTADVRIAAGRQPFLALLGLQPGFGKHGL